MFAEVVENLKKGSREARPPPWAARFRQYHVFDRAAVKALQASSFEQSAPLSEARATQGRAGLCVSTGYLCNSDMKIASASSASSSAVRLAPRFILEYWSEILSRRPRVALEFSCYTSDFPEYPSQRLR